MNDVRVAYLAGFFDGEGSISVNVNRKLVRWSLRLSCHQVNPAPLRLLADAFGGSIRLTPRTGNQRPVYEWVAGGRMAAETIRALRPYLTVKADEADVALEFHALMKADRSKLTPDEEEQREVLYQRLRDLKHLDYSDQTASVLTPRRPPAKPRPAPKVRHKVATSVISAQGRPGRPAKGQSRKPDADEIGIFAAIYRDHGLAETALEYGVSRQTVLNWLDAYNIPRQGRTAASEARRKAAAAASWEEVPPRSTAASRGNVPTST